MSITVLIIDDAIHIRRLAARMLERVGFDTLEAGDGLKGLELLKQHKPDIVTCDISMPLMDGHEFLTAAKLDPAISNIPIIVVTAVGQEGEAEKATEMGADAYLTKPFSSSNLIETIQNQLKRTKRYSLPPDTVVTFQLPANSQNKKALYRAFLFYLVK